MTRLAALLVAAVALLTAAQPAATQTATRVHRVGVLWANSAEDPTNVPSVTVFQAVLRDAGYVDGRNLRLEHRFADGKLERFALLASELVHTNVDVIVAPSPLSIRAARAATSTIPIVMINGDPAMFSSHSRPGGNTTGLTAFQAELAGKQVELLKEAVPKLSRIALLRNPTQPIHALKQRKADEIARALMLGVHVVDAQSADELETAVAAAAKDGAGGLVVFADGMYYTNRGRIADLALRHALPAIFGSPGAAEAGGLMSYLPSREESYRRAANYVARILKGAHPGDLPIEQPTRFELSKETDSS